MAYISSIDSFLKNSRLYSAKPYLHQPIDGMWHTFSYVDVEQQARCIAKGLQSQGFKKGDRIGIFSKNCAHWFIADLAIMMAGMISVPIYATAGTQTISYISKHSKMKAIFIGKLDDISIVDKSLDDDIIKISFPYPGVTAKHSWQEWLDSYPAIDSIHDANIDDIMTIVYTSGTTGDPKGVEVTYKNLASAAQCTANVTIPNQKDRMLSYLPLAHITERSVVECVSFYTGVQVYFIDSLDTFIDDLKYTAPTVFLSVPRLWAKFQAQIFLKIPNRYLNTLLSIPLLNTFLASFIRKKLGLHKARLFASGSAPISDSLLKWYEKIGIEISEGWGMSETAGLSCGNFPFSSQMIGSIGVPVRCVKMKLSDEKEIMIKGDSVFTRYYLDPEMTEKAFTDGWFHTGDCAEMTNEGAFKIVGRIKEQFKTSKGKYVAPAPIESMVCRNPNIEQICIMGIGLKQPVGLVVLGEGRKPEDEGILKGLESTLLEINSELESHQRLDYLMVCKDAWTIENDLLTPTLKVKRNNIETYYAEKLPKEGYTNILVEA